MTTKKWLKIETTTTTNEIFKIFINSNHMFVCCAVSTAADDDADDDVHTQLLWCADAIAIAVCLMLGLACQKLTSSVHS